jgi:hypothetical protein
MATLVNEEMVTGNSEVTWDARLRQDSGGQATGFASEIYSYRLSAVDFVETKKLILLQ